MGWRATEIINNEKRGVVDETAMNSAFSKHQMNK